MITHSRTRRAALLLLLCVHHPGVASAEESPSKRQLIIHADDAGMSHSVNMATIQAMEQGVVSSASIMVPCPWFPEIAAYAKEHPQRDFGVHLTLNSEWKHYRWGPVASRSKVPSLVDEDGYLWANVRQVAENAKVAEVEIELRAQIERAKQFGVPITHLDTHMGALVCRPDLVRLYVKLSVEYDLPILFYRNLSQDDSMRLPPGVATEAKKAIQVLQRHRLPVLDYLPSVEAAPNLQAGKAGYLRALGQLKPGISQIIIHCGVADDELKAITSRYAHRDTDRRVFIDPEVISALQDEQIEIISWRKLLQMHRR